MAVIALRGRVPAWALRGYGSGYGSGDGSGYGSGYGYGDGSGYGYGYGSGDGSGYGDGDGDGSGYGDGSGSGSGYGYGYGDGSGYGDGDGDGSGYGSGEDVERCVPQSVTVTARHLKLVEACSESVWIFKRAFPNGAEFPRDIPAAIEAELDLEWAREKLGLLMPLTDEVPV